MTSLLRKNRRLTPTAVEAQRRRAMRSAYLGSVMRELNNKFKINSESFALNNPFFVIDFNHPNHVVLSFHTVDVPEGSKPKEYLSNQRLNPKRKCWGRVSYARRATRFVLSREVPVEHHVLVNPEPIFQVSIDLGEYNPAEVDMTDIFFGSKQEEQV